MTWGAPEQIPGWELLPISEYASIVWRVASVERKAMHLGSRYCPTRIAPYSEMDPYGGLVHPSCDDVGCLDLHHDLLAITSTKVAAQLGRGARPLRPAAYLARVTSNALADHKRSRRASMGLPARPHRKDGVAGKVRQALEADGSRVGEWHATMFRILCAYIGTSGRQSHQWPIEGLLLERMNHFPEAGPELNNSTQVKREIDLVVAVAQNVAGHQWTFVNLTMPLITGVIHDELPDEVTYEQSDPTDAMLATDLRKCYLRLRKLGTQRKDAIRKAAVEVTGHELTSVTPEIERWLQELEAVGSGISR